MKWHLSRSGLRRKPERKLELTPDNWDDYYFGMGWDAFKLNHLLTISPDQWSEIAKIYEETQLLLLRHGRLPPEVKDELRSWEDIMDLIGKRFYLHKCRGYVLIPGIYEVTKAYNPSNLSREENPTHAVCIKVRKDGALSQAVNAKITIPIHWLDSKNAIEPLDTEEKEQK